MSDDRPPDLPNSIDTADDRTFERLFAAYSNPLCRFVCTYVTTWAIAEELVDDIFLELWLQLRRGKAVRDLKSYLFATARNRALKYLRRQRVELSHRAQRQPHSSRDESASVSPDVERQLAERDFVATIERAIDLLPPRQREVVLLKLRRAATNDQIGDALGISPATVAEHFRRALNQLRATLPRSSM